MEQDADRQLFGSTGKPTKTALCNGAGTHKLKKYLDVLLKEAPLIPILKSKHEHPYYYSTARIFDYIRRFLHGTRHQWVVVILPALLGSKHLADTLKLQIKDRTMVTRRTSSIFKAAASVDWNDVPDTFFVGLSVGTTHGCLFVETNYIRQRFVFVTSEDHTNVGLLFSNIRKMEKTDLQRHLRLDDKLHLEVRA